MQNKCSTAKGVNIRIVEGPCSADPHVAYSDAKVSLHIEKNKKIQLFPKDQTKHNLKRVWGGGN